MEPHPIELIIKKLSVGDSLSDPELATAIGFYRKAEETLRLLGPYFHLAWKEVYATLQLLNDFHSARSMYRGRPMGIPTPPPASPGPSDPSDHNP